MTAFARGCVDAEELHVIDVKNVNLPRADIDPLQIGASAADVGFGPWNSTYDEDANLPPFLRDQGHAEEVS